MKQTPPKIQALKNEGKKIVVLTAYDFPTACIADEAGVDILLVGDSLANVVQGKSTTLPVTLNEIIYHAEMVGRAANNAMVVTDLPFPYCQLGPAKALKAAARILKESGTDAVKIEGGEKRAGTVEALVDAGIPVMGHCGLLPQDVRQSGGFFVQRQREQILRDAVAVEKAGAFCIVLECCIGDIAAEISQTLTIPTIGIGSSIHCDGQVLVFHDLLNFKPTKQSRVPKHVRQYADLQQVILDAVKNYAVDVREQKFPGQENSFR